MKKRVFYAIAVGLCITATSWAQVPSYVPTNGLVGWWPFNGNANDESGNGNNGTVNGATLTTDRFGNNNKAYNFNGVNNYIQVANSPSLQNLNSISAFAWIRISQWYNNFFPIINKSNLQFQYGKFAIAINTTGGIAHLNNSENGFNYSTWQLNQWYHVGYIISAGQFSVYVNGQMIINASVGNFPNTPNQTLPLLIGADFPGQIEYSNGKIDDIGIWNRSLDACEVQQIYNSQLSASISANGPTTFCIGGSVTLTANPGSNYLWSTGATSQSITVNQAGNYSVTVTSNGCTATSAPTTVIVNSLPTATISASGPTTFCTGSSVTLTASQGSNYLWSNGATSQSITVSQAGNYSVTVTSNGCSATSTATTVNVLSLPLVNISANGPTTFCTGSSVTLTASAGSSYLWSNGATSQSITVSQAGNYSVTVTDANGCTASANQTVTVLPLPSVSISPLPSFVNINAPAITLSGSPSGGAFSGAGISNNQFNPSLAGLGSAQVSYTFTNGSNCSNSASTSTIVYDTTGVVCTSYDTTYISVTDTLIINTGIAGLNPPNNQNTILVYPNPTNDHITIHYGNFALMAGYQLRIENTLGQQVFQTNITQQSDYLPLSTWGGNGLYFVRILDTQGNTTELRKIILE